MPYGGYLGHKLILLLCVLTASVLPLRTDATEPVLNLKISADAEVPFYRYNNKKNGAVILWLPSEVGILEQERNAAARLAELGFDVWMADVHSGFFLPKVGSSMDVLTPALMAKVINHVAAQTQHRLFLVAQGKGAIALLQGVHEWQRQKDNTPQLSRMGGAILLSPQFFQETPEPGFEAKLKAIVAHTNLALMIIQPDQSPYYWKLKACIQGLEKRGSDVLVWVLKGLRDRFYFRPDANAEETKNGLALPDMIRQSVQLLKPYAHKRRTASSLALGTLDTKQVAPKEKILRPYRANAPTPELLLENLVGDMIDVRHYNGRVVLVNFWASWCPPCVHEMPSMQKLQDRLKSQGFTILAVNMAEERQVIEQFLTLKVKVDFPILLDKDGNALQRWKVFSFPTSYLLDKHGKIRYAVFGAIDWLDADVIEKIQKLLAE